MARAVYAGMDMLFIQFHILKLEEPAIHKKLRVRPQPARHRAITALSNASLRAILSGPWRLRPGVPKPGLVDG
jgi:hypothetical protein